MLSFPLSFFPPSLSFAISLFLHLSLSPFFNILRPVEWVDGRFDFQTDVGRERLQNSLIRKQAKCSVRHAASLLHKRACLPGSCLRTAYITATLYFQSCIHRKCYRNTEQNEASAQWRLGVFKNVIGYFSDNSYSQLNMNRHVHGELLGPFPPTHFFSSSLFWTAIR